MSQFVYRPLETKTSIRLVSLHPFDSNPDHGKLRLQLRHCELSQVHGKYSALSYVWGNPAKVHTVSLNDGDFQVTDNLMFFLRRWRSQDSPEDFWIDAICINQNDNEEKSVQIPLMCAIYENAAVVHAELGPASPNEGNVILHLRQIHLTLADRLKSAASDSFEISALRKLKLPFTDPYESKVWNNIKDFFDHPWWYRAWVMQEATATQEIRLYYGTMSLPWIALFGTAVGLKLFQLQKPWQSEPEPLICSRALERLIKLIMLRYKAGTRKLLRVIELFRGLSASNPRDTIYAGLGIANDQVARHIHPDYGRSVSDVYQDVVVSQIHFSPEPSEFLGHCGTFSEDLDVLYDIPSWVPQWHVSLNSNVFHKYSLSNNGSRRMLYDVCRLGGEPVMGSVAQVQSMEIRGSHLHTRGMLVDQIRKVHKPSFPIELAETPLLIYPWVPSDPGEPYIAGGTQMDAFLKTLVADLDGDFSKPESIHRGGQAEWDPETDVFLVTDNKEGNLNVSRVLHFTQWRSLAVSEAGYFALVSHQAREGDLIFLFTGCPFLYTLRPQGDNYIFVGECYVHGMMDGEAISLLESGSRKLEGIVII